VLGLHYWRGWWYVQG